MRRLRRLAIAALLAAATGATPALAQQMPGSGPPHDRIMAVVGGDLLLESEWREQTGVLATQIGVEPGTPEWADIARESFDQMINEMVIVAVARRDTTIDIPEERVADEVDADLRQIQSRFPSEQAFLQEIARSQWGSLAAYRADLLERKRRELLGQAYLDRHRDEIEPPDVTDEEVRAYWDENREQFGDRPEAYRFEEISVRVTPDEEDVAEARAEAERVLAEIRAGKDFAAAAKQYSDDGSAENGGDLGWFGEGQMVEPFEEAAFAAEPGELVGPVETPFGFHVLQVIDRRPDEVRARHVLIAYDYEDADVERARAEAERIRAEVNAGADVDSLQAALMPGDSLAAEPLELAASQLPDPYREALQGLEEGRAETVELAAPGSDVPTFNVVVSRGTTGGDPLTFEEMAPRIRRQLEQQKAEAAWVERLRAKVYVDVRIPPNSVT